MALTKTDIVLQEEANLILVNRDKLEVGKVYKYKKLVETLEIRVLSGKAKIKQVERIRKYIKWDENFLVTDNHIEIDTSEVVTKGVNSIYFKDMSDVLLFKLAGFMVNNPKVKVKSLSTNKAITFCNLLAQNYELSCNAKDRKNISIASGIEMENVDNYISFTKNEALGIFETTCRQLEKKGLITLVKTKKIVTVTEEEVINEQGEYIYEQNEEGYWLPKLIRKVEFHNASAEELSDILTIENDVLNEIGMKNKYQVNVTGNWKRFKNSVCKKLDIENYYECYDLALNRSDYKGIVDTVKSTYKLSTRQLKELFSTKIEKSNSRALVFNDTFGAEGNREIIKKLNDIFIYDDEEYKITLLKLEEADRVAREEEKNKQLRNFGTIEMDSIPFDKIA